ncbi:uncharacterized protein EI97DRAFT_380413 [Westerdykella ornata]|uniref:Lytic polysaccharide monooxygenase n=1 Tax=Westerdykella ornata TaxID=318751 RepID=A0A6A6JFH6_WESOR|nr:uncharacterized protein EI97DRAFT_380413 [Westerdykella ornata]KAF2274913.1 hypothetical protein EI97DRAFT_380413 [Westerdykella ornata]
MTFRNTLLAAVAIVSSASAHIIMESPVPYSVDTIDNGPINAAQFPCKNQLGYKVSKVNKMAVGETQTLSFKGSAVHNGGLCQLSVALSREPTANTPFKVIKTIQGGCPGINGAEKFSFQIPKEIPNGDHTFAWTWMPVSSGGPEYYMNCAPIEVTGGAGDESGFNQLPDMLVANLPGINTCTQVVNTILEPPNPGANVEKADNTGRKSAPPTGDCGPKSGGGSPPVPLPSSSTTAVSSPTQTSVPSNPGGIFAPGASNAPQSTTTTLPQPTGTPNNGSASCPTDGAIVCNGESQFGLCNHGSVVWQAVAAGTACRNGVIQKREYRGRIVRRAI